MAPLTSSDPAKSISSGNPPKSAAGCMVLFFGAFLLAGIATTYPLLVKPAISLIRAQMWAPTTCTILSSQVVGHSGSKGPTYSVAIRYEYVVNGTRYKSDAYDFMPGSSSSGYDGKVDIVNQHPPGSQKTCYINPADPGQVVLNRGFQWIYLMGLLPLVFVAVGGVGVVSAARSFQRGKQTRLAPPISFRRSFALNAPLFSTNKSRAANTTGLPAPLPLSTITGRAELKGSTSPMRGLISAIFFTAVWNGVISIFLYKAYQGRLDWGMMICMTPFVVIGFLTLLWVPYQFMALFSPRARLSLAAGSIAPGESADLEYTFVGRTGLLRSWQVTLEAREEATYGRGTNTITDKNVFFTQVVVDSADAPLGVDRRGHAVVAIPADAIHSFDAPRNKVVWLLRVTGDVAFLPNIKDEYRIVVLPPGGRGGDEP
ncbi:MAG: DUF3592 domain-containing protein [Planctomycetota bacterium]|nr:DUF3592 domain-containing protein [Planctomycetota bacterium]